jgi:lysophospholipase L1-like esterase
VLLWTGTVYAWPTEYKLTDINGDCRVVGTVIGDSFAAGYGDTPDVGGYVDRVAAKLKKLKLINYGIPGLKTTQLLDKVTKELVKRPKTLFGQAVLASDFIILDLGRNDRWDYGAPEASARNLWRIRDLIQQKAFRITGTKPVVVIAVLMLPNRGAQGPWVSDLNRVLYSRHTFKTPADLRFDLVSKRLLTEDQLHPSPEGHQAIAQVLKDYFDRKLAKYLRSAWIDTDKDQLADKAEVNHWLTDPTLFDTDGDGRGDGRQMCN